MRLSTLFFLLVVPLLLHQPAKGITIVGDYRPPGEFLLGFGTAGNAPSNSTGAGNLQSLFEAAASYWESAFADPFVLTIEYGWFPRDSSSATHRLLSEGGSPHRETYAAIAFDNDSVSWFLDATPFDNTEYSFFTNYSADLGGGLMNTGREYTGGSGAAATFDLLTTAIHEIGHALGLASGNDAFNAETVADLHVNISGTLAYSGAAIPVFSGDAHIDLAHALLRPTRPNGVRRFASEADILVNAQIAQFSQVNLFPVIPEPAAWHLIPFGFLFGSLLRFRARC